MVHVFTVSGCTDPAADNYDATATVDDGSCTYSSDVMSLQLQVYT